MTAGLGAPRRAVDHCQDQIPPADGRLNAKGNDMYGHLHQQVARERHREACLEARRARMVRALRAERRARRAVEVAVRAGERVGGDTVFGLGLAAR